MFRDKYLCLTCERVIKGNGSCNCKNPIRIKVHYGFKEVKRIRKKKKKKLMEQAKGYIDRLTAAPCNWVKIQKSKGQQ